MGLWDHFLFHLPLPVTVFGVEGYRVLTMLAPSVYVKISFSLAPHCATKPNTKLLDTVGSISYYIYVYIYIWYSIVTIHWFVFLVYQQLCWLSGI